MGLTSITYELPYAINITLYKHNYYDRIIIGQLKKNAKCLTVPNITDSFIVEIDDFKKVINIKFEKEIQSLQNNNEIEISKNASSIYFINKILDSFLNLKYIKVNISDKNNFTRLIETEKNRFIINFEYKIITCIIDFADYLEDKKEFQIINKILRTVGLIKDDPFSHGKSYLNTTAQELLILLSTYEDIIFNEDGNVKTDVPDADTTVMVLDIMYELVDKKMEEDNSRLILITDYLN